MGLNPSNALYIIILATNCIWVSNLWNVGRALNYRNTIDLFVSRNKDLHALELSNTNWESIKLVVSWLKSFRLATTEMSTTKSPMLSMTHAIFQGLQDDIKGILHSLPNSVSPRIKLGLTDVHRKLSNYYYQYNASPFYTWAACMWDFIVTFNSWLTTTSAWSTHFLWRLEDWVRRWSDTFQSSRGFKDKFIRIL